MVEYLIDVNLPKMFEFWAAENFLHVFDLDDEWSDSKIWEYAKSNGLTIITKDADFSNRIISSEPPPKVIHFRTGNMKMAEFHDFIKTHWQTILESAKNHKLVNVYRDKIISIA